MLESQSAKAGITIVWPQSAGCNKALEFFSVGSIYFGPTAGSSALVATRDLNMAIVADLKGKRQQ